MTLNSRMRSNFTALLAGSLSRRRQVGRSRRERSKVRDFGFPPQVSKSVSIEDLSQFLVGLRARGTRYSAQSENGAGFYLSDQTKLCAGR